ncbi:hypothetical protein AAHS21_23715 [Mycobacterium sp. 050272]|uniref:hypothetical protein n=1 Tax=Mycobacterium sp. 050272 TaxID=3142488 RepID=UPI00318B96DD
MTVLIVLVVFVFKFAWLIGAVAAAGIAGRLIGGLLARRDDCAAARRRRNAELCARADQQNAWAMAGDARGVYGDYPIANECQSG